MGNAVGANLRLAEVGVDLEDFIVHIVLKNHYFHCDLLVTIKFICSYFERAISEYGNFGCYLSMSCNMLLIINVNNIIVHFFRTKS